VVEIEGSGSGTAPKFARRSGREKSDDAYSNDAGDSQLISRYWSDCAARADDRRVTLYTAPLRGDTFNCNAVNVSQKTLYVGLAILDDNGDPLTCTGASCPSPPPLNPAPPVSVLPGIAVTIGSISLAPADVGDGYCKVTVDAGDRDDLRAVLNINLTRTIPGTSTPVFVVRSVEGY